MKDALSSAEMRATNISGSTVYASTTVSGAKVFADADITAVTSVTAGGSIFSAGGSCVGLFTAGSFTATD